MNEGLALVKPETAEEWLQFVDNNSNDDYSVYVVKATIFMMKEFDEGVSFIGGSIANALSRFAKQGEEYRKHWNKQWGIEDSEEKGTINPAVLNIKKK